MKTILFLFLSIVFVSGAVSAETTPSSRLVKSALSIQDHSIQYDSSYRSIVYPMGDVPSHLGVCSDVIIRAYRPIGIDLQERVHKDMKENFSAYPKLWGLSNPDTNIDHRRVPNLRVYFKRHGDVLKISQNSDDFLPGDIVTWNLSLNGSIPHIGIVTDKYSSATGNPLIMHNIVNGQVLEDMLFDYKITGHYRYGIDSK